MTTVRQIEAHLRSLGSPAEALAASRFFKTGPGEYGEGDQFLGLRAATVYQLARDYQDLPPDVTESLLHSKLHEARSVALQIWVRQTARAEDTFRKDIYRRYLANTRHVNNWDLVDASAPSLVGAYLLARSRRPLYRLARSASLWERRIAIVATLSFIRQGDLQDTLDLAVLLKGDQEDLIHKATGWMLREVGKRDVTVLEGFLKEHGQDLPRTALRYAIERFPQTRRQAYLRLGRPRRKRANLPGPLQH